MAAATAYGSFAQGAGDSRRGGHGGDTLRGMDWTGSRQITPSTASSQPRQWSSHLTRFRDGRGAASPQRLRSTKSEPLFRLPKKATELFAEEGFDSAARLPAIGTPGGSPSSPSSRGFFNSQGPCRRQNTSELPAVVQKMRATVGGASSSTAPWPVSVGNRGFARSLPPSFGSKHHSKLALETLHESSEYANSNLLCGLSSAAKEENMRRTRSFELLDGIPRDAQNAQEMREARTLKKHETTGRKRLASDSIVMQDFAKVSDELASSVCQLRCSLENFRPGASTAVAGGLHESTKNKTEDRVGTDQHALTKDERSCRAERLEAFKMVRKIEPELPPLVQLPKEDRGTKKDPAQQPDQEFVLQNTSFDSVHMWLPEQRQKHRLHLKELHDLKMRNAAEQNQALQEVRVQQFRKAVDVPSEDTVHNGREHRGQFVQQWLTMVSIASFFARAHEEMTLQRMTAEQLLKYVNENNDRFGNGGKFGNESEYVKNAIRVNACLEDPFVRASFGVITKMFMRRKDVQRKRQEASVICDAVSGWKRSGRIALAMYSYRRAICRTQTWWRKCRKRLHEQRDHVAKRWKTIERAELLVEQAKASKAEQSEPAPHARQGNVPKVSHKLNPPLPVLDDVTRTRFIENELRARRYLLLPRIERWREDQESWRRDVEDRSATKEALHVVGQSASHIRIFRWPPTRPSFMPPAHFRDHEQGKPCRESCPGRRGDAEILEMWNRARKNAENYTRIPLPRHASAAGSTILAGPAEQEAAEANAQISPYGPPPSSAEQKRFGAEMDMPGILSGAIEPHASHARSRTQSGQH